jgi:drug/metabolite transporter (DMT)-like permease
MLTKTLAFKAHGDSSTMSSFRHLFYFVSLGLFWGLSPSFYKYWSEVGMPATHIIVLTGIGVGAVLAVMARRRQGKVGLTREVHIYGAGCAFLLNVPFGLGIYLAGHVPPTELALTISTSPLVNYALALATGRSSATPRRLFAIMLGLASSVALIVTRGGGLHAGISGWLAVAFTLPFLYAAYSWFASIHWPGDADTLSVGTSESIWSAIIVLPPLLLFAPPWSPAQPALSAYWSVGAACLMWVIERIAYFTLIKEKGAVYTVQAVYLSTPAAVIFASLFFGGGYDAWLWLSLALLMAALWLNNSSASGEQVVPVASEKMRQT